MAKKKPTDAPEAPPVNTLLTSTAELAGDAANPRKISEEGAAGLRASLKRFGDLSGIVWNQRTSELVAGHRRMEQIRAEYGELPVELVDEAAGLYGIRVDSEHYFPVRVVDWSVAKQRAANVAANNQKIQGTFTAELSTYLLSVEAELAQEMPGVLADCLMVELMSAGIDTAEASGEPASEAEIKESYQVIVQATDEEHQKQIYERLTGEGLSCKVLTL